VARLGGVHLELDSGEWAAPAACWDHAGRACDSKEGVTSSGDKGVAREGAGDDGQGATTVRTGNWGRLSLRGKGWLPLYRRRTLLSVEGTEYVGRGMTHRKGHRGNRRSDGELVRSVRHGARADTWREGENFKGAQSAPRLGKRWPREGARKSGRRGSSTARGARGWTGAGATSRSSVIRCVVA
jgi:hypothetical protein